MHLLNCEGFRASMDRMLLEPSRSDSNHLSPSGPASGLIKFSRDKNDVRGKLPLCLIATEIGIADTQLLVAPGGLMGRSDGALIGPNGSKEPIEARRFRCKKGKDNTVTVNDIRLDGTDWQRLSIVSRRQNPDKRTDFSEHGRCGFRLAYAKRRHLLRAAQASGCAHLAQVNATITPGCKRGWLGRYLRRVSVQGISRGWWARRVLSDSAEE
jgi:hypothetical protein